MSFIYRFIILLLIAAPIGASAQPLQPGEWRTYTSMRSISALAIASDPGTSDSVYAWAATSGGVFRVNLRDTTAGMLALHTTEGLFENDLTAIASDASGNTYFGGRTGGFDVYRPSTGKIERLGADIQSISNPVR